jgi:hypothetical protein
MGSLADELEKVKVGLPRSKSVSISRALSHPPGDLQVAEPQRPKLPAEKMVEAYRCN